MTERFFDFVLNTTLENFSSSQREVMNHQDYNPYSEELDQLELLLDNGNLLEVINYTSINTILSPRAHLYKNYALEKLGKKDEARAELILACKIMEGVQLTGDGSREKPFVVTRISDEKDMLGYLDEEFLSQELFHADNGIYDLIECQSGREICFDITLPYRKMNALMDSGLIDNPIEKIMGGIETRSKRWWEFWK